MGTCKLGTADALIKLTQPPREREIEIEIEVEVEVEVENIPLFRSGTGFAVGLRYKFETAVAFFKFTPPALILRLKKSRFLGFGKMTR